jgi:ABC-type Mn2+/Zn2+ transport system permease subunit
MTQLLANPLYRNAFFTASALAIACALLSVLVVIRRWAFIGEGISHAGFGGIGTAWLASLAFAALGTEEAAYSIAVVFCLVMALVIGWVSRKERLNADAAIGIVLVASLAWGIVALAIHQHVIALHPNLKHGGGASTAAFDYLLGDARLSTPAMLAGVAVSVAVIITLLALHKEVLYYCMDPALAEVSGVRAGFVHYLLMLMLALVIVVGMRLAGSLLVTALLVLPGATALSVTKRLGPVVAIATLVSLVGTIGGLAIRARFTYLPNGPAIVLVLVAQFVLAYTAGVLRRDRAAAA